VTLVTEMDFSHLLYPTSFCVYIRLVSFFDHHFLRSFIVLILFSVLNDLINFTSKRAKWSIGYTGINNGTMLDNYSFSFQLLIKLLKKVIIQILKAYIELFAKKIKIVREVFGGFYTLYSTFAKQESKQVCRQEITPCSAHLLLV